MLIELKSSYLPDHRVLERMFFDGREVASLTLSVSEWKLFGAALLMGSCLSGARIRVVCTGDDDLVENYNEVKKS